jgi:hypothetical protein
VDAKAESPPRGIGDANPERSASAPPGNPRSQPLKGNPAEPTRSEGRAPAGQSGDQGSGANSKEGVRDSRSGSESESDSDEVDPGAVDFHKERFMKLEGLADAPPPAEGGADGELGNVPIGPSVGTPRSPLHLRCFPLATSCLSILSITLVPPLAPPKFSRGNAVPVGSFWQ